MIPERHISPLLVGGVISAVLVAPVKIRLAANQATQPETLQVLVICDASKSGGGANLVSPGSINYLRSEVIRALSSDLRDRDAVRVASFSDRWLVSAKWTRRFSDLEQAFDSVSQSPGDVSPLWDAMYSSVDAFAETQGRHVVIVVTDGKASGNTRGFDEAVARVTKAGVKVYAACIVDRIRTTVQASEPNHPARRLKHVAEVTRGQYVETIPRNLPAFFRSVIKSLNTAGLFHPANPESFRPHFRPS